jgi:hypothetical protein
LKKIILCEGDSWTAGDIIDPDLDITYVNDKENDSYRLTKVWPYKLGKLLDIEVQNTSMAGSSNDGIVRRVVSNVLDLLKKYNGEDIFVIVGWSSPERKDFYFNDGNDKHWETIFPNAINDTDQISDIEKERQEFYKTYLQYYWNEEEYFNRYIHNNLYLHYFLKSNNIEHLFFDAFYQTESGGPLYHTEEMRKDGIKTENKFLEITKHFYKDISFKNFILEDRHFSKDNSHPNEKGHQVWAEELSKDLQWIK